MNLDRIVNGIVFEIAETFAYGDASDEGLENAISVYVEILKLRNVNESVKVDFDKIAHGILYAMMGAVIFGNGSKSGFERAINAKLRELNVNANVNLSEIWGHLGIKQ